MTLALAAGWLGSVLVGSGPRRRLLGGVAGAALVVAPGLAVLAGIAGGAAWVKGRLAGRRHGAERIDVDVAVLADLVALGLAAGVPVHGALTAARRHVGGPVGDEVDVVLAGADRRGLAAALTGAEGHAGRLFRLLGRAVVSGAPAADAVEAFAAERRHARHAARLADARRLPVRLLLPLALLILPGFVVLAVGPAVMDAMARLGS